MKKNTNRNAIRRPSTNVISTPLSVEFSGPSALLALAKKVAAPGGNADQWSQWMCDAIEEKLEREKLVSTAHMLNKKMAVVGARLAISLLSKRGLRRFLRDWPIYRNTAARM